MSGLEGPLTLAASQPTHTLPGLQGSGAGGVGVWLVLGVGGPGGEKGEPWAGRGAQEHLLGQGPPPLTAPPPHPREATQKRRRRKFIA